AAAAARRLVTVRVDATGRPTFLCVDDGAGDRLFAGTLSGKQTFKGKRIRLNVGVQFTRVTVNGQPVRLAGSPAGLAITRKAGASVWQSSQSTFSAIARFVGVNVSGSVKTSTPWIAAAMVSQSAQLATAAATLASSTVSPLSRAMSNRRR